MIIGTHDIHTHTQTYLYSHMCIIIHKLGYSSAKAFEVMNTSKITTHITASIVIPSLLFDNHIH